MTTLPLSSAVLKFFEPQFLGNLGAYVSVCSLKRSGFIKDGTFLKELSDYKPLLEEDVNLNRLAHL
jgi:hypothetical protein